MSNISILPQKIKLRQEAEKKWYSFFNMFIVVILLSVIAYGVIWTTIFLTTDHVVELRLLSNQQAEQQEKIESLEQYQDLRNRIKSAETLMNTALAGTPDWHNLLKDLGTYNTNGIVLDMVAGTYLTNDGEILISGMVQNHVWITDYLNKLYDMPGIENVHYETSILEQVEGGTSVRFLIKASLLPGPLYDIAVEGGL